MAIVSISEPRDSTLWIEPGDGLARSRSPTGGWIALTISNAMVTIPSASSVRYNRGQFYMPRRRAILTLLSAIVVLRSAVFVFAAQSQFDSDQAITGLMAKHLSELRAFPVFWYGQTYMLGVEAWLAAPVMVLLGPTVAALKLPLLAINVAIVWLLFEVLTRDGVGDGPAAVASLFFALAAPITSAHFVTANGGNVEPLLYVLLLWLLRERAIWMGLVLGIGFLNREFTIYGLVGLFVIDACAGRLLARAAARRYGLAVAVAVAVWVVFAALHRISSAAGPGTSVADLHSGLSANNLLQIADRLCMDWRAIAGGFGRLFTIHLPYLFGLERQPLTDFGIESRQWQGLSGSPWLLVLVIGLPIARLLMIRRSAGAATAYLVVVAAASLAGYAIGRCGLIDFSTMRYELLSVIGAAGLGAWYLQVERIRPLRVLWTAGCALLFAISVVAHVRLLHEYVTRPPRSLKQELIHALDARNVRYGYTDYWVAYYVDFMTRERIILAPEDIVRVRLYNRLIDARRSEAVRITRSACAGGDRITSAFWLCRMP